jgi:hypothetical protein
LITYVNGKNRMTLKREAIDIGVTRCADDTIAICETTEGIKEMTRTKDKIYIIKMDKIYNFKFLGIHVTSDGDVNFHIDKRKPLAIIAAKELEKIGLKNALLDTEMKGLMIQSLARSK